MDAIRIAKESANAAQACFSYYCGKKMSDETINKIMEIVLQSDPSFSEGYLSYKTYYESKVEAELEEELRVRAEEELNGVI